MSFIDYSAFAKYHAGQSRNMDWKSRKREIKDEWKSKREADIPRIQASIQKDCADLAESMQDANAAHIPSAYLNRTQVTIELTGCKTRIYSLINPQRPYTTVRFCLPAHIDDSNIDQFTKIVSRMFFGRYKMYVQGSEERGDYMMMFSMPDEEFQWALENICKQLAPLLTSME